MRKHKTVLGPDAVAVIERLAEVPQATVSELMAFTSLPQRRVERALEKLRKQDLIVTRPAMLTMRKNEQGETVFGRTPEGQLVYDLAMSKMQDRSIARKHGIPVTKVRELRAHPAVQKLRRKAG